MNAGYKPRLLALGPNYHVRFGSDECSFSILRRKSWIFCGIFVLTRSWRSIVHNRGECAICGCCWSSKWSSNMTRLHGGAR